MKEIALPRFRRGTSRTRRRSSIHCTIRGSSTIKSRCILADVLVLVDWENIHYTLRRAYSLAVPPQVCIEQIAIKARSYGTTHVSIFYNGGLTNRELGLAIRACEAYGEPLYTANPNEQEKNLADTYIATEAMCRFFKDHFSLVIIVSGDNGYTPVLRAIRDNGGKAIIFSLEKALAGIIKNSLVGEGLVLLDDLISEARESPDYRQSSASKIGRRRPIACASKGCPGKPINDKNRNVHSSGQPSSEGDHEFHFRDSPRYVSINGRVTFVADREISTLSSGQDIQGDRDRPNRHFSLERSD